MGWGEGVESGDGWMKGQNDEKRGDEKMNGKAR